MRIGRTDSYELVDIQPPSIEKFYVASEFRRYWTKAQDFRLFEACRKGLNGRRRTRWGYPARGIATIKGSAVSLPAGDKGLTCDHPAGLSGSAAGVTDASCRDGATPTISFTDFSNAFPSNGLLK